MDYIEVIKRLNYYEQNYPVNEWNINGMHLWPHIRIQLGFKMVEMAQNKRYGQNHIETNIITPPQKNWIHIFKMARSVGKKVVSPAISYYYRLKSLQYIRRAERVHSKILFFAPSSTSVLLKDKWYSIFFGPLADYCVKKNIPFSVLEYNNGTAIKYPKYHSEYIEIDTYLKEKNQTLTVEPEYIFDTPRYSEFYKLVTADLEEEFPALQYENLVYEAKYMIKMSHFFVDLIRRKKVGKCFITCYYFSMGMALCYACHRAGIKSIDVQHGSQANWFPYIGWKSNQNDFNTLPSRFWNWTTDEVEHINKWADHTVNHKAFVGGNPWLQKWHFDSDDLKNIFADDVKYFQANKDSTFILFTVQPFGSDMIPLTIEWVIKNSPLNYIWLIRMHPRMLANSEELEKELRNKDLEHRVEFRKSSTLPLPLILSYTQIHITQESSTVIEAELMHIPSIITSKEGSQFYLNTVQRKMAIIAETKEAILTSIKSLLVPDQHVKSVDTVSYEHVLQCIIDNKV